MDVGIFRIGTLEDRAVSRTGEGQPVVFTETGEVDRARHLENAGADLDRVRARVIVGPINCGLDRSGQTGEVLGAARVSGQLGAIGIGLRLGRSESARQRKAKRHENECPFHQTFLVSN